MRAQFYQLRCAVRTEELIVGDLGGQHEDLLWATSARSPAATFFRVQRQGLQIFLPIGCRRQSTCLIRARGSFAPHPQRHLANFTGLLQADAFAGYADLYLGGQIHEAACMAHARRKLHDRHAVRASPITSEALERIGALYRIEEHIRGKPPEERRRIREERAVPLLEDIRRWFEATRLTLQSDPVFVESLACAGLLLQQRSGRDRQSDCRARIARRSNRKAEFFICRCGLRGERAAAMYSLIGSARLNGIGPEAYLHYVIERIADHPANRIDERPGT
ncbi:UNVERIFIED_ORG: hypothetical protein ABIC54_006343 [Burkholderia sp. 1263]